MLVSTVGLLLRRETDLQRCRNIVESALSVVEPERFPVFAWSAGLNDQTGYTGKTAFPVGGHCRAAFQSAHRKEYGYLRVSWAVAPSVAAAVNLAGVVGLPGMSPRRSPLLGIKPFQPMPV